MRKIFVKNSGCVAIFFRVSSASLTYSLCIFINSSRIACREISDSINSNNILNYKGYRISLQNTIFENRPHFCIEPFKGQ